MNQGELFDAPKTEPCRYDCGGKALLGPERYNATRTCMNQSATCQKCGKVAELSHNLTLAKAKKARAA